MADVESKRGAAAGPAAHTTRTVSGVCHGTLGELFQGPVRRGAQLDIGLVSFPFDRYAWCHFISDATADSVSADRLPGKPKSAQAAERFLRRYRRVLPPGRWTMHSELDTGVGMASSTADIIATLRCLFRLFGIPYDPNAVIDLISGIERADSVFLDEYALYLSARHQVAERLGATAGFHTCFISEPGTVDTESVTADLFTHYRRHESAYARCLTDVTTALRRGDNAAVARAATTSAALSQLVLPKHTFDLVMEHRAEFGADGVFVAHTGSLIGYLYTARPSRAQLDDLSAFFSDAGHQCSFARGGYSDVRPLRPDPARSS